MHTQDADCNVSVETLCCVECGVDHSDPCPECGGRGFHLDGCTLSDAIKEATGRSFEINPSNGGWLLTLKENGVDAGGGFFPDEDYGDAIDEGQAWREVGEGL